jgi:hypothetical protein
MKSDTTSTVLNFVLVLLAVCGVIFAIMTFMRTQDLRNLRDQATADNNLLMRVQTLGSEVNAYNLKKPDAELTHILQSAESKSSAK